MACSIRPHPGETLAVFLARAITERRVSINGLARRLSGDDDVAHKSWQRALRRWKRGETASLSEENAAALTEALDAEFLPYARGGNAVRDLLTQALERLDQVEARLAEIERA